MEREQYYTNWKFDRAVPLRERLEVIDNQSGSSNLQTILIWKDKIFVNGAGSVKSILRKPLFDLVYSSKEIYFIGKEGNKEILCHHLPDNTAPEISNFLKDGEFKSLRDLIHQISREDAAVLAYATGLVRWNNTHAFCGVCGTKTISQQRGHSRVCQNPLCSKIIYPRIDPAVIVLIECRLPDETPVCLLKRTVTENGYKVSTLAGFVEIGESLEDAVRREMKEEVDVEVQNIRYINSQPWPFPSSLMVGFFAEAPTKEFKVDNIEIKDAAWFTALELKEMVNAGKLELSISDSIARYLIETWIENNLYKNDF